MFEIRINDNVLNNVIQFFNKNRSNIMSYIYKLPEFQYINKLIEQGFTTKDIIKYVIYVGVNDWGLQGLKGGANTLWNAVMEEMLRGYDSFEELANRVILRLSGLYRNRKNQILKVSKHLDTDLNEKFNYIVNFIEKDNIISILDIEEFIKELSKISNIKIPYNKVANLIARTLYFSVGGNVKGKISIMYDVHVAKVSIRLGIIDIIVKDMDVIAISLFNKKLKDTITDIWNNIANKTNMLPWHIDAFLWIIGRNYCLFDDQVGELVLNKIACPEARRKEKNKTALCPLNPVCSAARGPSKVALFSSKIAGREVVVVLKAEHRICISKHV